MKIFLAFLGFVAGMLVGLLMRPPQPDDPLMRIVPALVVILLFGVGVGPALAASSSPGVSDDEDDWGDDEDDDWDDQDDEY